MDCTIHKTFLESQSRMDRTIYFTFTFHNMARLWPLKIAEVAQSTLRETCWLFGWMQKLNIWRPGSSAPRLPPWILGSIHYPNSKYHTHIQDMIWTARSMNFKAWLCFRNTQKGMWKFKTQKSLKSWRTIKHTISRCPNPLISIFCISVAFAYVINPGLRL